MKKKLLLLSLFTINILIAQVPTFVPTNGLIAYWPFNGNANDQSGNGNNGTVNGATLISDRLGASNSAYFFNGTSSTINYSNQIIPSNQSFSISIWTFVNNNNLQEFFHQNVWPDAFYLGISNGFLRCGDNWQNTGVSIEINSWIHIVLVRNFQNNVIIYKNGIVVATKSNDITLGGNLTNPLILGRQYTTNTEFLNGKLDDIGIWNRALTQAEITGLYTTLGTNKITQNNQITVYPNPAKEQITIDCGTISNANGWSYQIVNTLGQEVLKGEISNQQNVVSLNTLNGTGVYLVKIYDASNNLLNTQKIILQ